jgi:hypothetical protein
MTVNSKELKMKTKNEIQEMFDYLVNIRNEMNLDDNAFSEMLEIEHEIYALVWVLGNGKISLPYNLYLSSAPTIPKEEKQ